MSRYAKDLPTSLTPEQITAVATEYLLGEGFEQKIWKGENVWQKGEGFAVAPQFVTVTPGQGSVHLEAWIAGLALLPGVYIGEVGLAGGYGWAVKAKLKPRVAELERRLSGGGTPVA